MSRVMHATIPVRFQATVESVQFGENTRWYWKMVRGAGEVYTSEEHYSTEDAAYEAAKHELKLLRKEIEEENDKIRNDTACV